MTPQAASRPLGEMLTHRQKMVLLTTLMLSMFVGALDQTIMSTATPSIIADLGGFALLSWLFTSYMLASTVVVPLVGKLSDMFGRRIFLLGGLVIFMASSAACGAAPSMIALILFRAVQGIGGGLIFASVFSTVGDLFPPAERGKYMGFFTGTFSLASILGPTIGGLLTDHVGWRWVFFINVPFGLVAIPLIWRNLPHTAASMSRKIDFGGSILLSVSTVSLLLGLVWAEEEYGWGSAQTLGLIATAVVFAALFVFQEKRHPEPIIPLGLFRNRTFLLANLVVFALGGGIFGTVAYLPVFVQTSLGGSATTSGLITTPQSLGILLTSIVGGQIISRTGRYRWLTIIGACFILTATLLQTSLGAGSPKWHISVFMIVMGLGFGMVMPTMSVVIQNAVSHQYLGVATSARQFFMQIGQVLGTAIFGVVLATTYQSSFDSELSPETRTQIPAATLSRFDDPTMSLDERTFGQVKEQVRAVPNGDVLLDDALDAQRVAVADGIHRLFLISVAIAVFGLAMTLLSRELPLRRGFGPAAEGGPQGSAAPIPVDAH
ncbi:MAG TPA: MDR family MFS transporter [Tepidiformaceae bacterium]|nr:MDR family MFS transporter [Tepidiformaceae bacterium]